MMKAYSIKVEGTVQGVFFRKSAQDKAMQLGLTGWVKNEVDGSVKIFVQGDQHKLSDFIAWCEKGPELAAVSDLTVEGADVNDAYKFFQTIY